ncbi:MAG: magnesium/cobalt transporter CorA [Alphaproteobacteria bacterium]
MLTIYVPRENRVTHTEFAAGEALPTETVWGDLHEPTAFEVSAVEHAFGVDVPTRDEMKEIEASSRLRREEEGLYMTALVLAQAESDRPLCSAITFILSADRLVTLRYADPQAFHTFATRMQARPAQFATGETLFLGLLDAIIDRAADILEKIGDEVNALSHAAFSQEAGTATSQNFKGVLRSLGHQGDLISKARESLVSMGRMIAFLAQAADERSREARVHLDTVSRDIASLSDYATFLANKVNFLLEATLGLLNVEQNNIIKIFSVAAVVLMPPTLIASIYGMNFHFMPELSSPYGYPLALAAMVVSAIVPYLFFRFRGWL